MIDKLIEMVREVNPGRKHSNLNRKLIKVAEEIGEIAEAYLNVTSSFNGKNKTWADVREEIVDVLILAIDISLTPWPTQDTPHNLRTAVFDLGLSNYNDFEDAFMWLSASSTSAYMERRADSPNQFRNSMRSVFREAVNLAYTPFPDQPDITLEELEAALEKEMRRKLDKWVAKMARMENPTDDL